MGKIAGKSFSNLGNMHIFGKPCISGIRKYVMSWYKMAPENEKKAYRFWPWVIFVPL
jgi:hypothetical protein